MVDYRDPTFLNTLIQAVNEHRLVLFVGAGLSKLCGVPLWSELANALLEQCAQDERIAFRYDDLCKIKNRINDPRELISIAKNLYSKHYSDGEEKYRKAICDLLSIDTLSDKQKELANEVSSIVWSMTRRVATTNADVLLDSRPIPDYVFTNAEQADCWLDFDKEYKILHLHGSINDPSGLVFTTVDYLQNYAKEGRFRSTLRRLFDDERYVILFIGYGFSEMQLLDFLVNPDIAPKRLGRAFFLNGYYSFEECVYEAESEYYREYGVQLISFSKDKYNYEGLLDALRFIRDEIQSKSIKISEDLAQCVRLVSQRPSGRDIELFARGLDVLSPSEKEYVCRELVKGASKSEWASCAMNHGLISNCLFPKLEDNCGTEAKQECLIPGMPLLLDNQLAEDERFAPTFSNRILSWIDVILRKNSLRDNAPFMASILRAAYLYPDVFASQNFIGLLSQAWTRHGRRFVYSVINSPNALHLRSHDVAALLAYLDYLLSIFDATPGAQWHFEQCLNGLLNDLLPQNVTQVFKLLLKAVSTHRRVLIERTAFEIIENAPERKHSFLLEKLIIRCMNCIAEEEIKAFYGQLKDSDEGFYRRLSIFLANKYFCKLRHFFWMDVSKLCNQREYYAELYSLVKNNVRLFEESDIREFNHLVRLLDYGSWSYACQRDLLLLVPKESRFDVLLSHLKDLEIADVKDVSNMPAPLERSKLVWAVKGSARPRHTELDQTIMRLKPNDLLANFSVLEHQNQGFLDELDSIWSEYDACWHFSEWAIRQSTESGFHLPEFFVHKVYSYYVPLITDYASRVNHILSLYRSLSEAPSNRIRLTAIEALSCALRGQGGTIGEKLARECFEFAIGIKLDDVADSRNPLSASALFDVPAFQRHYVLASSATNLPIDYLKRCLDEALAYQDENKTYALSAIVVCISKLWNHHKSFIMEKMGTLFGEEKADAIIAEALAYDNFSEPRFIQALAELGVLSKCFGELDDYSSGVYFCSNSIASFCCGDVDQKVLNSFRRISLTSLSMALERFTAQSELGDTAQRIASVLNKVELYDGAQYYSLDTVEDLLPLYACAELRPSLISCCVRLLSESNEAWDAKPLLDHLDDNHIEGRDREQIVATFLWHLDDTNGFEQEIGALIRSVSWSDATKEIELINWLSRRNPELYFLQGNENV